MTSSGREDGPRAHRIAFSSGLVFASRIAAQAGSLAVVVLSARELGTSGRGELALIVTITTFLSVFLSLGLPVAARLLLVDTHDPVTVSDYLGLSLALALMSGLITPFVTFAFMVAVGATLPPSTLVIVGAFALAHLSLWLLASSLAALGRVVGAAAWEGAAYGSQGALSVALVSLGTPSISTFVGALAGGLVVGIVGICSSLHRHGIAIRPTLNVRHWKRLITVGWPSLATLASELTTFRVDRLLLGLLAGTRAVGIYSVAATGSEALRLIPLSMNQLLFYEITTRRIQLAQYRLLRLATSAVMVLIAFGAAIAAPTVIDRVFGPAFSDGVVPFRVLLLAELCLAFYLFDSTLLLASGLVWNAAAAALAGLGIVVLFDLGLIPPFGIVGAAMASAIAYAALAIIVHTITRRARARHELRIPGSTLSTDAGS